MNTLVVKEDTVEGGHSGKSTLWKEDTVEEGHCGIRTLWKETKNVISERRDLQQQAVRSGSCELRREFNRKNKE